jgi:CubicO group peptidase (beta-lactamase class C family)
MVTLLVGGWFVAACGTSTEAPAVGASTAGTAAARGEHVRASVEAVFSTDDRGVYRRLRSILVSVDDRIVVEQYRQGQPPDHTLEIQSITKSVLATLIGIAIQEGKLAGVDEKLGQLLPEYADVMTDATKTVTLRQLLTMSAAASRRR